MKKIDSACIIDDDHISIFGLKLRMQEVDFSDNILVYKDGQEAINGLMALIKDGERLPSVIFLDLNMPIMDGWEFLEGLNKIPSDNLDHVMVYILSSSVDPRDIKRAKNYSIVSNYISKPMSAQDLNNILAEIA